MEEWGPTSGDGGLVFDGSARCRNPPPNTLDTSPPSRKRKHIIIYERLRDTEGVALSLGASAARGRERRGPRPGRKQGRASRVWWLGQDTRSVALLLPSHNNSVRALNGRLVFPSPSASLGPQLKVDI
ncbi:hypothetical protein GW17_00056393 [Ensete ventricosum]|nr:hypothetical protein GW17_00056393 [Ensete ventricosum]